MPPTTNTSKWHRQKSKQSTVQSRFIYKEWLFAYSNGNDVSASPFDIGKHNTHTHSTALHAATAQRQNYYYYYASILVQRFNSHCGSRWIVVYYCYLNRNAHLTDDQARPNGGKSLATCIRVTVRLNLKLAITDIFHIYPHLF